MTAEVVATATPDLIAAAVLGVPEVAALHPGEFGEVATYLPGRRVVGIRLAGRSVEVHVVLRWGTAVAAAVRAVQGAVGALGVCPVDVVVEDVVPADRVAELVAAGRVTS